VHFSVRAVRIPKAGSQPWEYEDDLRWNRGARGRRAARRYAVADGASESSFAKSWATLLTYAYVHDQLSAESLRDNLVPLQARWQTEVDARPLPWYAAEKARAGAYAALIGLTLHPGGLWTALAAGDCCMFQVRDGLLLRAFPFEDPDDFSRSPLLISSNPAKNERVAESLVTAWGDWHPDDVVFLMSDALAAYFLREVVSIGRAPLDVLPPRAHSSEVHCQVEQLRASGALRNDDVSLIAVQITDATRPSPLARSDFPAVEEHTVRTENAGLRNR
jgi:hypothetical protein